MAAPANDNFASAEVVTLATDGTFTSAAIPSTEATREVGEPAIGAADTPSRTVWFSYTPSVDAEVTVDTELTAPILVEDWVDTKLGVYTGASVGALTLVASNDDAGAAPNYWSRATFAATAGTTYYFQVGLYDDTSPDVNYVVQVAGPLGPVGTDASSDVSLGYNYDGFGEVGDDLTAGAIPAGIYLPKIMRVHQSLPAPTLVDGRPT